MKAPKPLFTQYRQLYVKIISLTLIPLIFPPDLIDMKIKNILKNNPRKNNQWDLLLEPAAMYHQFTLTPQAESAQPDLFVQPLSQRPSEKAQTG